MKKAIFIDRDGVIVKNVDGEAPKKAEDLKLNLESVPIMKKLQQKGYSIFVISNQPDVALGKINENVKKALLKKFRELLRENNISVGIYYCFHHPRGVIKKYQKNCDCRKPKPGMLLKAIHDYKIDPLKSFIIGDRARDIKAGNLAGVRTILIDPENSEKNYLLEYKVKPDFTVNKLLEVTDIIIIKENS